MILADKILNLRKQQGWSQEELAAKLNVSRQAVSKWESAQSMPDLDRIIKLSQIFGVSVDYLVNDEMTSVEWTEASVEAEGVYRVSMEEANQFLAVKAASQAPVANAVSLFILSPVVLITLYGIYESKAFASLTEELAAMIGVICLLVLVAIGVYILIRYNQREEDFKNLESDTIETEYGVSGMVKERKTRYQETYYRQVGLGVVLCILSAVPVLFTAFIAEQEESWVFYGVAVLLCLAAMGVNLLVRAGIQWTAYNILLAEGEYSPEKKRVGRVLGPIAGIYWLIVLVIFLWTGLVYEMWDSNWIIWVIAGLGYGIVAIVVESLVNSRPHQ